MGENGNEKDKRVKLENYSTLELFTKLDHEQDDEKWTLCWAELLKRQPFQEMDERLEIALKANKRLEERLDILNEILKKHEHLHGSVVVKI